eukprot:5167534-Amphidinium_carterae.1
MIAKKCEKLLMPPQTPLVVPLSPSKESSLTLSPRESEYGCADWQLQLFHAGKGLEMQKLPLEGSAWRQVEKRLIDLESMADFWKERATQLESHTPSCLHPEVQCSSMFIVAEISGDESMHSHEALSFIVSSCHVATANHKRRANALHLALQAPGLSRGQQVAEEHQRAFLLYAFAGWHRYVLMTKLTGHGKGKS